jgi:hypothetical protein
MGFIGSRDIRSGAWHQAHFSHPRVGGPSRPRRRINAAHDQDPTDFVAWWQVKSNWDIAAPGGSASPCLCVADTNGVIGRPGPGQRRALSPRHYITAGFAPLHSLVPLRTHARSGLRTHARSGLSSAHDDQHHSAGKRQYADDRGQGNPLLPVDRGLERSKVNDLLPIRVVAFRVPYPSRARHSRQPKRQPWAPENPQSMAGSSAMIARGLAAPVVMLCGLLVLGESLPALLGEPR